MTKKRLTLLSLLAVILAGLFVALLLARYCLADSRGLPSPDRHLANAGHDDRESLGSAWHVRPGEPSTHLTRTAAPATADVPAITGGQPFTYAFPRLGMWWPDPWEQSLDDIARYDWVILNDDEVTFLDDLELRNPDMLFLNSTNACELSYDWQADVVREMPAAWFLTQVGTTLTQGVDATETLFHVAQVTVSDGADTYDLFVSGDTAVIESESVRIRAVNKAAKTLTVQRGFVRPASAHSAGTRIAAHISFWPGSWVMNLSTLSPTAVISTSVEPERWGDYNARVGIGLLSDPAWDGLLIDRSGDDQSWLIGSGYARTIDPDQSNTLLSDYTGFDESWAAGLRQYEAEIRAGLGPDRLILANWGMANYDLLNGNNFEGEPRFDESWRPLIFGPYENGSYFDWLAQAQTPNMTMLETYEIDTYHENNPCAEPGFVPDYRKMRFGLTSALLGDGFFSYEIGTNGHGSLCLMWFDEYDNAGAGRGYLGQPTGSAYRASSILLGSNMASGGDFESQSDLDQWSLWADSGYQAAVSLDTATAAAGDASARIDISQTQGTDWQISLGHHPVQVISGSDYTLTFWARADRSRPADAWVQQDRAPWDVYLDFGSVDLTPEWQHFELVQTAQGSYNQAELDFGLGQALGSVWLDDVQLRQGSRDVWRRDYQAGTAIVNGTAIAQTVRLERTYQKIAGSDDPIHNDGSLVAQVAIPPRDGIILLRTDTHLPAVRVTALNSSDLRLSWENDGSYAAFQVFVSTAPYFTPADPSLVTVDQAPWRFDHAAALGDAGVNRFYKVVGLKADGSSTVSGQVGEFDFALTSGE